MRRDLPGDDPRPLDEAERAELARIERSLMVEEPWLSVHMDRALTTSRRSSTALGAVTAVTGVAAIAASIVLDAALLGGAGFVAAVLGLDRVADGRRPSGAAARFRRALGVEGHRP